VRLGLAGSLATALGATAVTLDELRADAIAGLVKDVRDEQHARTARHTSTTSDALGRVA
jgi:magnesium chelatase subunit D